MAPSPGAGCLPSKAQGCIWWGSLLAPSDSLCPHSAGMFSWRIQKATGTCQGHVHRDSGAGQGEVGPRQCLPR